MPAVVRIKRRIDEEPHTAFVLNGKRRRLQNDENAPAAAAAAAAATTATPTDNKEEELSQVLLKFAGTIDKQDDSATRQFAAARLNKEAAKALVLGQSGTDAAGANALRRDRQRQEAQQSSREQRYRVVNCLRTTMEDEATSANDTGDGAAASGSSCSSSAAAANAQQRTTTENRQQITIVDIESQEMPPQSEASSSSSSARSLQQQPADSDVGYVYDLYVPENETQADYVDLMDDNYLSLRPLDELVLEDCYNDRDEDDDSEDSNQENYYTNDYPDEDDEGALGSDEEICRQMNRFMFDDDEDEFASGSSNDDDDDDYNTFQDPYVHTIDAEHDRFVDDVDFCNVDRQGSAYDRYKRRIMRDGDILDPDSDDEEYSDAYDHDAAFESASETGNNTD